MTLNPTVTGTSVVALKYKGGVMVACDTLGSYGTMARFKDFRRVIQVNATTLLAADGEIADFQLIQKILEEMGIEEKWHDDGNHAGPRDVLTYLARLQYRKRSKIQPLWNSLVVAGWDEATQTTVLGTSDLIGTMYEEEFIATGLGMHLALPILRAEWHLEMEETAARALLEQCMRVLYYRDCTTINRISFAKVTKDGVVVDEPVQLVTQWSFRSFVTPKSEETGSW
jgi:20S proteasome subunit beta 7